MWTKEIPIEEGWYLWRFCPPNEPPVVGPLALHEFAGHLHIQEFSAHREGNTGSWEYHDWVYAMVNTERCWPVEYMHIGPLDVDPQFIRAFRDLYEVALRVHDELNLKPDFNGRDAVNYRMLSEALNTIHEEFNK